jgi:hypothetical protein
VPLSCIDMFTIINQTRRLHSVLRLLDLLSLSTEPPLPSVYNVYRHCVVWPTNGSAKYNPFPASADRLWNHRDNTASTWYFRSQISLIVDTYVILITGRESVGHLTSHEIWRLTKFEIVPLRLGKGNAIQVFQTFLPVSNMQAGPR